MTTFDELSRRRFLLAGAATLFAGTASAQDPPPLRLIPRTETPLTLETPLAALDRFITPNDLFYVRNHFPTPTIQANTWRLRVEGAVEREIDLSLEELRRMPSRSVRVTLECAGNSRTAIVPPVRGVQWSNGAVSTAEWTGVPLSEVLDRAGLRQGAVDVVLEGADQGEVAEPRSPGAIHYARSLPLVKARQRDVLLAYRMNGADLPTNHGAPLRAVVPGWYGMASVKWLSRVIVSDRPYTGFFQSLDYSVYERRGGLINVVPITEMQVKAQIVRPAPRERIAVDTAYRVTGAAWTGETEITRVEISSDGGRTWGMARLLDTPVAHCWRLWEFPWRAPAQAGRVTLMARATDARGRVQPAARDADRRTYLVNHMQGVEVVVE
jgi:DMSO/TMAO reductase YedYZ molybdopterin-dependent catalytic subunit